MTGPRVGKWVSPLPASMLWPDLLPEHLGKPGPYLSSHSQAPPAASQFPLVTTSRDTPARTVPGRDRTFGCQGCRSAYSLQRAAGETGRSALLVGDPSSVTPFFSFLPLLLPTPHIQPEGSVTVIHDGWTLQSTGAPFSDQSSYSVGRWLESHKHGK